MSTTVSAEQQVVCAPFGMQPVAAEPWAKVGISLWVRDGLVPLNGTASRAKRLAAR